MSFDFDKVNNDESLFDKIHKDTQSYVILKHYNDYIDYKQIPEDYSISITDNTITCSDIKSLTFLYYASRFMGGFDLSKCDDYSISINGIKTYIEFPSCLEYELWKKATNAHTTYKCNNVYYHQYNVKVLRDCILHFVKNIANNTFIIFDLLADIPINNIKYDIELLSKTIKTLTPLSDIFSLFDEFIKQSTHFDSIFIDTQSLICLGVLALNDTAEYIIKDKHKLKYIIRQLTRMEIRRNFINKEDSTKFYNDILSCIEKK